MAELTKEEFLKIPGVEDKINSIADKFGFEVESLLTAIENESNFDVTAKNSKSSATGLIQFMSSTAKDLDFDHNTLLGMDELGQLDLVEKYFDRNHKEGAEPYMTIALPAYGKKPLDEVLYDKDHKVAQDNPQWADPDTGHVTRRAIESYGTINKNTYKDKQQELVNQGYDIGPSGVDGSWGSMSKKAWHNYKRDQEKNTKDIQEQIENPEPQKAEPDATAVAPPITPEVNPGVVKLDKIPVEQIPIEQKEPKLEQASQQPTMLPEVEVSAEKNKGKIISGGFGMNPDGTVTLDRSEEDIIKPEVKEPVEEKKEEVKNIDAKNIKEVDGKPVVEIPNDNEWLQEKKSDGTVDYPFFNKGEVDVLNVLTEKYPQFSFKGEWFGSDESGGLSAVKISTKDGKNSASFDVNIEGTNILTPSINLYDGPNSPTSEQGRLKSYNTLVGFVEKHNTKETISLYDASKEERSVIFNKVNEEVKTAIKPSIDDVLKKYNDKTLFKETEEIKYVQQGKLGMTPPRKMIIKNQPYQKQIDQAISYFKDKGMDVIMLSDLTREQIEEKALDYVQLDIKREALKKYWEENGVDNTDSWFFGGKSQLNVKYELAAREFDVDFKTDLAMLEISKSEFEQSKGAKTFNSYIEKLNDPTYQFPVSIDDDLAFLDSGQVVPKKVLKEISGLQKALVKKHKEINLMEEDIMEKLPTYIDNPMATEIASKIYNDVEKSLAFLATGFAERFLVDVPYGLGVTFGGSSMTSKKAEETIAVVKNYFRKVEGSYSENVQFKDAFKSIGSFANFAVQEAITQAPIFATLAIPGIGIGVLHAGSAGNRYSNLVARNNMPGAKKLTASEMWWNTQGYATAESVFNYATTLPLIRAAEKGFRASSKVTSLGKMNRSTYFKENIDLLALGVAGEPVAEGLTGITQNLIDKKPWHENLDHMMFSGLMFGTTLSTVPFAKGMYLAKYNTFEENRIVREKNKTIQRLQRQNVQIQKSMDKSKDGIDALGRGKEDIDANNKQISELNNDIKIHFKATEKRVKGLSRLGTAEYFNILQIQEVLRSKAEGVENQPNLTRKVKDEKLKALQNQMSYLDSQLQMFLTPSTFGDPFVLYAADEKNNDNVLRIKAEAVDRLDSEGNKSPTEEEIMEKATDVYVEEVIIKDHKESGKKGLNNSIMSMTIDEGVKQIDTVINRRIAALNKLDGDFTSDIKELEAIRKEAISNIKRGDNGVSIKLSTTNSRNVNSAAVHVVENQVKNFRRPETRTHEVGHNVFTKALGTNPLAFAPLADAVLEYLKSASPAEYAKLTRLTSSNPAPDEVVMVFLEMVADQNSQIGKDIEKTGGFFGFLLNEGVKKSGVEIDFAGETDAVKFLIGLGKKIKNGTLSTEDIRNIKKNIFVKEGAEFDKNFKDFQPLKPSQNIDPADIKLSIDPLANITKYKDLSDDIAKALWRSSGDGEKAWQSLYRPDIQPKLRRLIKANADSLDLEGLDFDKDLYIDEVMLELRTHILAFNPKNTSLWGYINSYKKLKGYNVLKKGKVVKKVATKSIGEEGTAEIASTDTAEDSINKKQREARETKETQPLIKNVLDNNSNYYKFLLKQADLSLMLSADLYSDVSKNRKKTEFISDLKKKLGEETTEASVDFLMGKFENGKRDPQILLENLKKYRPVILRSTTTSWLAKNFPNAIQKSVGGSLYANGIKVKKGYKPKSGDFMTFEPKFIDDWQGKVIDKETASVTGRTSNHQIIKRRKNVLENVDVDTFVNHFMQKNNKGKYRPRQMRVKALGYQWGSEVGLEIIADDIKTKGPLYKTLENKQSLLDNVLADNVASDIAKQIERGGVKASTELSKLPPLQLDNFYSGLPIYGEILAETGDFQAAFNAAYPEEIIKGRAKRNKIAQELANYYSWFNKANEMAFLSGQPNFDIETIIRDEIKANDFDTTIDKLVGVKLDLSDLDQLQKFRGDIVKIAQTMGWEKAQRFLQTFLYSSGYIGATSATPNVEGKKDENGNVILEYNPMFWVDKINKAIELRDRKIEEGADVKSKAIKDLDNSILKYNKSLLTGAEPDTRYGAFESAADFERNVLMLLDGYKPGIKNSIGKGAPQNVKVDVSTRKKARSNYKSAALSKDFLLELMDVSKKSMRTKGGLSLGSFGLMMKMINNSGMGSVLASAAHVAYTVDGAKSSATHRYEHLIPRKVVALYLASYALGKNDIKKSDIRTLLKDFAVAIIPLDQDIIVGKFYKSSMPNSWVLGVSPLVRYFNPRTFGKVNLRLTDVLTGNPEKLSNSYANNFDAIMVEKAKLSVKALEIKTNLVKSSENPKGISVFDFDETAGISDNVVIATRSGVEVRIPSDQWPVVGDKMVKDGWKMDFSDFNKVTNGRPGPLMQKLKNQIQKYGASNVYILTARAAESQKAIHEYLKSEGVNIPIENITGLGNSTGEAKADWFVDKLADGYNDFYFVDDALPNVTAVDNLLSQFDVKSKVVQAIIKSSQNIDVTFNDMLEYTSGVDSKKEFSKVTAMKRGKSNGKFRPFIPPGAEDFAGLLGNFIGKGEKGNKNRAYLKEKLQRPYARAYEQINQVRVAMAEDYAGVRSKNKEAVKILNKKILKGDYTNADAVRVYLWDQAGYKIPGLAPSIQQQLIDTVKTTPELLAFSEALSAMSRTKKGWGKPSDYWTAGGILGDINNIIDKELRSDLLAEWKKNKDIIFSPKNLNKIEAIYGADFRSALEDMLFRMEYGSNRPKGLNKLTNKFIRYLNGSVSAIMFFNGRSATLQMLSTVNFINYADNNIVSAAKAFANQPQFWSDFVDLWNSDYIVSRRKGMKNDISTSELAAAVQNADNKTEAAIAWMLEKGFLPTKYADSFAIALGGATFYRNRIKHYMKKGESKKEAERKAFIDFQEIAEETQQSSRPDFISQQQASLLGRPILAFQNTPMQMTRLMKKALLDIVNRRITKPNSTQRQSDISNISRILYYGAIQNFIFYSLQSALFALAFDEDEDEAKRKNNKKYTRVASGMVDTFLRGTGIYGAIASTAKNTIIKILQEEDKGYNKDVAGIMIEILNLSPPLGSKMRKIVASPYRTYSYQKRAIKNLSNSDLNNPIYEIGANVVEGVFNIPTMRILNKYKNITEVLNSKNTATQRIFLGLGWDRYGLNVEKPQYLIDARKKKRSSGIMIDKY